MTRDELTAMAKERAQAQGIEVYPLAGTNGKEFLSVSKSAEPGKYWMLTIDDEGKVSCNCPGVIHRQSCKHSAALEMYIPKGYIQTNDGRVISKNLAELEAMFR